MSYLLIRGDARRLPLVPGSVDAVVSDPPYGIGYVHSGRGAIVTNRSRGNRRNGLMPINGDDRPFDPSHLLAFPCVLWGANHYADRLPRVGSWLTWDKAAGGGPADSFADAEFAWCSLPGVKRNIFRYLWKGVCQAGEKGKRRHHPTQKPVALMRWCIGLLGLPEGATIADPYMGSGTTGVAAAQMGLSFVGMDNDRRWLPVGRRRIGQAEMTLFAGAHD